MRAPAVFFCWYQIVCEDTRLRTACTTANQSPPGGGREDILKMELNDLRAGEASIRSEVEAVESRVQRYCLILRTAWLLSLWS